MSAIAASLTNMTMPTAKPAHSPQSLTVAGQPLGAILKTAAPLIANGFGLYIWLVIL